MNKAFIDTTVLTNILLKTGDLHNSAKKALSKYKNTALPVYAIKEFKAGPLRNFIYIYNKLTELGSYSKTLKAISKIVSYQRYKAATSLEALSEAFENSMAPLTTSQLKSKYGEDANQEKILCDESKLYLKARIFIAWKKRRTITTEVVCPLQCYEEVAPYIKHNRIEDKPVKCSSNSACSIAQLLKKKPDQLQAMRDTIKDSTKLENKNRSRVLRKLIRTPKQSVDDKDCRYLGDAVFAFLAPKDSTILTTNRSDHEPLAKAIGKVVTTP